MAPSVWYNTRRLSQIERNVTPCDLSPTTRRGTALDEGEGGSCSHVPGPGRKHIQTNAGRLINAHIHHGTAPDS